MSRGLHGGRARVLWVGLGLGLLAGGADAIDHTGVREMVQFPDEKSPRPRAAEWKQAASVRARTAGETVRSCRVIRVREWVRLSCPELSTAAVRLVSGEARNVYFFIEEETAPGTSLPRGAYVEMAVRRTDQRIIEFWTFGPGYDGPLTVVGSLVFQQSWPEAQPEPTFFLSDVLHEPIRTATAEGK